MHRNPPPTLETFSHWPSWLNAYGNLDRSACFELRVSQVRRLAGCIPLRTGPTGKVYKNNRKRPRDMPNMPNERRALGHNRLISKGHYDITPWELDWLARQQFPRRLAGDWRTGRAPAMRCVVQSKPMGDAHLDEAATGAPGGSEPGKPDPDKSEPGGRRTPALGMTLQQGGHGPGERVYERKLNCWVPAKLVQQEGVPPQDPPPMKGRLRPWLLPAPDSMEPGLPVDVLDAGLDGNPNRGACREKRFGLNYDWTQRLMMEKHKHASVSGVQYFLVCPGPVASSPGPTPGRCVASPYEPKWVKNIKSLKGCRAGKSPCNRTAYKLFWVLARPAEHRDALLAEQWIASLDSGQLARQSKAVSALVERYGPIMGDDRKLRCRLCLNMRYGKSPEASRKWRERKRRGPHGLCWPRMFNDETDA